MQFVIRVDLNSSKHMVQIKPISLCVFIYFCFLGSNILLNHFFFFYSSLSNNEVVRLEKLWLREK